MGSISKLSILTKWKGKSLISRLGWCLCTKDKKWVFRVEVVLGIWGGVVCLVGWVGFWFLAWNGKAVSITENIWSFICNKNLKSWSYFTLLILNVQKSLHFFVNKFVFVLPMILLSFRGGCLLFFLLILVWSWTFNTVNAYTCKIFE